MRRAWAKGLTPSSPAAVPKKDAVNASPVVDRVPLKQDRGPDPEQLLDAVFGGGDDDGGATPARSEPPRTPVSALLRSAKSPEHPLSAGKGGVEAGGGPPGSPWSPAAAAAPAVVAPAAQPAETARTPTSQASSRTPRTSSSRSFAGARFDDAAV